MALEQELWPLRCLPSATQNGAGQQGYWLTFTLKLCSWATPETGGTKPMRLMKARGKAEAGMLTNLGISVANTLQGSTHLA